MIYQQKAKQQEGDTRIYNLIRTPKQQANSSKKNKLKNVLFKNSRRK